MYVARSGVMCDLARAQVMTTFLYLKTTDEPIAFKLGNFSMGTNKSITFTSHEAYSTIALTNGPLLKLALHCNCTCARAEALTHSLTRENMQIIGPKIITKFEQNRLCVLEML